MPTFDWIYVLLSLALLGLGGLVGNLFGGGEAWRCFTAGIATPFVISSFAFSRGLGR